MSIWLRRIFGIHTDTPQQITRPHFAFATPWSLWWAVALLAAATIWFAFNYWRDGRRPNWWVKAPLVLLRVIALAALMIMLAQPTLRLNQVDRVLPNVFVLVDASNSMARPDPHLPASRAAVEARGSGIPGGSVPAMTRIARANALLNQAGLLAQLSSHYHVHVYSFAATPHALSLPTDARKLKNYRFAIEAPGGQTGKSTQIGTALRAPLTDLAGQPIAGGLIISDGGSNLGEDPLAVADEARAQHIPISTMGVGDPTKTRDVALVSVLADDVVRANNTVTAYAELSQRGYAGRSITASLLRNGQPFQSQSVRLGPDDRKQEIHFTYVPTQAGRYVYTVRLAEQPGEVTVDNNHGTFTQDVIQKKLKVLYVENEPRYEYRYLRNAILRDTSLDFGCLLLNGDPVSEGNIDVKEFPTDEKSLFEYDIVVLGDVPRSYFSDAQLTALMRFVQDRGASLLVIAGEDHMPNEYAGTPLEPILPVSFSANPDPVLTDDPFQWQLTPEGRRSPIMQLEDDPAENTRVWQSLPGMFWCAGSERAKPGATVLAVHSSRRNNYGPYPVVAFQPFGSGKCFMELCDSTWRWRWRVGDRYFYRYWGQVFRTLTPKELPGNSHLVQINADRRKCSLGEKVTLSARLLDAYYHPVKVPSVTAIITTAGGQTQQITLQATPGSAGLYTTEFQPQRVGHYVLSLTSLSNPQARASTTVDVEDLALERQKPELDETTLQRIAAAGGGRYYQPDALQRWARSLSDNALVVQRENEIEIWNAPLLSILLIVFMVSLSLEWLVRKRKGLL